ncbi:MAG: hypothetical protein M1274_02295 [Actinobacteria bacterium]|nr:hypothetical protein [Actinomycetota bacterium]
MTDQNAFLSTDRLEPIQTLVEWIQVWAASNGVADSYSSEQWHAIAVTLPSDVLAAPAVAQNLMTRVLICAWLFLRPKEVPKHQDLGRQFRRLLTAIDRLVSQLNELDEDAQSDLEDSTSYEYYKGEMLPVHPPLKLEIVHHMLADLRQGVSFSLEEGIAQSWRGAPVDGRRQSLTLGLIAAWEEAGHAAGYSCNDNAGMDDPANCDDAKYSSPFLTFAEAAARPLMGDDFRKRAFVKQIQTCRRIGLREALHKPKPEGK